MQRIENRMDTVVGAIVLFMGLAIVWQAATRMRLGTFTVPGPGLFPLLIGCVIVLLAICLLIFPAGGGDSRGFAWARLRKGLACVWLAHSLFCRPRVGGVRNSELRSAPLPLDCDREAAHCRSIGPHYHHDGSLVHPIRAGAKNPASEGFLRRNVAWICSTTSI